MQLFVERAKLAVPTKPQVEAQVPAQLPFILNIQAHLRGVLARVNRRQGRGERSSVVGGRQRRQRGGVVGIENMIVREGVGALQLVGGVVAEGNPAHVKPELDGVRPLYDTHVVFPLPASLHAYIPITESVAETRKVQLGL